MNAWESELYPKDPKISAFTVVSSKRTCCFFRTESVLLWFLYQGSHVFFDMFCIFSLAFAYFSRANARLDLQQTAKTTLQAFYVSPHLETAGDVCENILPVVPHKAVAEVSKIGNL